MYPPWNRWQIRGITDLSARQFRQRLIEHPDRPVKEIARDGERRRERQDVSGGPAREEDPAAAQGGHGHLCGQFPVRLSRVRVSHQVDANHQSPTADLAHSRVFLGQRLELSKRAFSLLARPRRQAEPLDLVQ